MKKYTIIISSTGEEMGRIEATDKSSAISRFRLRYSPNGEFAGIRLIALTPYEMKKQRKQENPSMPKDKWIKAKAIKFNRNGSVSIKK